MSRFLKQLQGLQSLIGTLEEWLVIVLVAAMAVIINLQIVARYLFDAPYIWPEEVSRLLLVWMSFIGAAALMRRGGDIAVDTFTALMPARARRVAFIVRDVLMIGVFSLVAVQGFHLAQAVATMPLVATEWPTSLLAWPLVLGGGLIAFHTLTRLLGHFCLAPER